ncbi:8503_t:CDS:2 [Ambispora leptoticha]|uniref:8503_t:CDS:1 n=1 Tax=Ambispora leptoticha TaxID=144679 RepID=A0A9N8VB13_9GLOM|nr:8503_t:CDS:2 [Ambispora leptoticha]
MAFSVFTAHAFGEYYLSIGICIGLGVAYSIKALIGYAGLVGAITDYDLLKELCTDELTEQKENGTDIDPTKSWTQTWQKRSLLVREPQPFIIDKRDVLLFARDFGNSTITHASPSSTQMNYTASNNGNSTLTKDDLEDVDNVCTKFIRWFTYPLTTLSQIVGILFTVYFAIIVSRYVKRLKQEANFYEIKKSIEADTHAGRGRSPLSRLSGDSDGSAELDNEKNSSSSSSYGRRGPGSSFQGSSSVFNEDDLLETDNPITNFLREELLTPEKRNGNFQIVGVTAAFGLVIAFLRNFGDLLAV